MESKEAVELLAALAQETRLAIFRHLVKVGADPVRARVRSQTALGVPGTRLCRFI